MSEKKVLPSEEDVFLLTIGLGLSVLRRAEAKRKTTADNVKTASLARELIRSQIKEISACFKKEEQALSESQKNLTRGDPSQD
jgi:hypothetical protein